MTPPDTGPPQQQQQLSRNNSSPVRFVAHPGAAAGLTQQQQQQQHGLMMPMMRDGGVLMGPGGAPGQWLPMPPRMGVPPFYCDPIALQIAMAARHQAFLSQHHGMFPPPPAGMPRPPQQQQQQQQFLTRSSPSPGLQQLDSTVRPGSRGSDSPSLNPASAAAVAAVAAAAAAAAPQAPPPSFALPPGFPGMLGPQMPPAHLLGHPMLHPSFMGLPPPPSAAPGQGRPQHLFPPHLLPPGMQAALHGLG